MSEELKPSDSKYWPGNRCDCTDPVNKKIHDDLCDKLEAIGYSEADVCTASVGMWGAIQLMREHFDPIVENAIGAANQFKDWHEQANKPKPDYKTLAEDLARALYYYASDKNWYGPGAPFNEDKTRKMIIASVDTEGENWLGGRTARLALKKYQAAKESL